jgi:hypothetical protein
MHITASPSIPVSIFIAGNYDAAKTSCREFCDSEGLCVTVTQTDYVYRGGEEQGLIVGLINYPRFPSTIHEIEEKATRLGKKLLVDLNQQSFSVQAPDYTTWFSNRPEDNA